MPTLQDTFFALSDEIERRFPVAEWQVDGIPVWPILRISLPHAIAARDQPGAASRPVARKQLGRRFQQLTGFAATPLVNAWRLKGTGVAAIVPAYGLFLGTGATYDRLDGKLQDRFCEPLICEMEKKGEAALLMEDGDVRVPQLRPVYPANAMDRWARLGVRAHGGGRDLDARLEGHGDMLALLRDQGLATHYFEESMARYHAALIGVLARRFQAILTRVQPRMAFMVRYYNELGYALSLACRRQGVLSVELQHGAQGGRHEAYDGFMALPPQGYAIMPAVFWNWTRNDTDAITNWARNLAQPWHRAIHGGHPQLLPWLDNANPRTRDLDLRIASIQAAHPGDKDILVALQDLPEFAPVWNSLADVIAAAPSRWRWWLRQHPSPLYRGGESTRKILALRRPNIEIEEASALPLPALLRHMDAMLCHTSGTTMEASAFGVPSIFLSENARGLFQQQLDSGDAEIITDTSRLVARLDELKRQASGQVSATLPPIGDTLTQLEDYAAEYRRLFA